RLWQLATSRTLSLTALSAFDNLLPLHLGDEGTSRENEAADCRVLELLCDEVKLDSGLVRFVEQYSDVILVAREAVYREGKHDVSAAFPKRTANLVHARAV